MADEQTQKEFLVQPGFKIDESQWSRFQNSIEAATLRAKLFGDALEAMAVDGVKHIDDVSKKFEDLFYAQARTLSDTRHIQPSPMRSGRWAGASTMPARRSKILARGSGTTPARRLSSPSWGRDKGAQRRLAGADLGRMRLSPSRSARSAHFE
jgi:hypothetical protein